MIFANKARKVIKVPIVFNAKKLKTCLPYLKSFFRVNYNQKGRPKVHVADVIPHLLTRQIEALHIGKQRLRTNTRNEFRSRELNRKLLLRKRHFG